MKEIKMLRKLNVNELERLDRDHYRRSDKMPLVVVLDNVRSLYNVGSVFRTADSFRIKKIILCGITATPDNSQIEIHKTALGAEQTVEWIYYANSVDAVLDLKTLGYKVIAVEQVKNSEKLDSFIIETNQKYALIFGNEVKGVGQNVVNISDSALEIPQFGTKHSLNVSVCAGIVLWEFAKQYVSIFR